MKHSRTDGYRWCLYSLPSSSATVPSSGVVLDGGSLLPPFFHAFMGMEENGTDNTQGLGDKQTATCSFSPQQSHRY